MRRQECFENWAALHDGRGVFPSEALESSWKRSEAKAIDYARALPRDLTESEIERSKKVYKRLLICSDWAVNHLVANSTEDELRVLLFSRDGVLLRIYGIITETDWLASAGIRAGTKWSEDFIGTNPFSLGTQQKRALDMTGDLCYARALVDGTYFFAPICVNENEVFGSVVVAVPIEKSNPYLFSVATTIARTIELDVFLFQCIDQFTSSDEESGSIFLRPNKGRNEVVLINDQVFKILGIKKPDTYHLTLEEIILPPPDNRDFWNIIDGKKTVNEKAIAISAPSGRVYVNMSTAIYKQNKFHPDGVTINFTANNKIGRFSPKTTDNNARYTFNDIIG